MKTPPITHVLTMKAVLFSAWKRHYKSDVSGFRDSNVLQRCYWEYLNLYPEWLNRPNWKQQTL